MGDDVEDARDERYVDARYDDAAGDRLLVVVVVVVVSFHPSHLAIFPLSPIPRGNISAIEIEPFINV